MAQPPLTAASFNQFLAEHRLMAARCRRCAVLYLPPRALCPGCGGEDLEWCELAGKGRLLAYTLVYAAPQQLAAEGYGRGNPYCVGVVQVDEGPGISARILGVDTQRPEEIRIGTPVQVAFIEPGEGRPTVLAFRAVE